MQRGTRRCKRRGRSRRPHHRPRYAACHWSTWSAASAASGLVLTAAAATAAAVARRSLSAVAGVALKPED
eukprot:scaffold46418_cov81-Phaeocystis_antarctica.AAC.1